MKNYHRHVLIEAVNYTEAEALATKWGINLTTNNIDILPIDLLKIDGLYLLNEETRKEKFSSSVIVIISMKHQMVR